MLEKQTNIELFTTSDLWTVVESSWPNVEIKNKKDFTANKITACVILCPLYDQGNINKAGLIKYPKTIMDSRVAMKLTAYITVINNLNKFLNSVNKNLKINFVVANKGILFQGTPSVEDFQTKEYHNKLYEQVLDQFCRNNDIEYTFSDFHDLQVEFPTFVNLSDPIPEKLTKTEDEVKKQEFLLIEYLNQFLILPEKIENNKHNRHVVKAVLHMNNMSFEGAFWLIGGYLAFDHKIHSLVDESGIYFVSERIDQLFGLAKLTPSLSKLTRVQIKA